MHGDHAGRYPARVDAIGVSCYSSTDLLYWKYNGLALAADTGNPHADLHPSRVVERPKVIFNEMQQEYVMWMHIDVMDYKAARTGVAVSKTPEGPFRYLGSVRPDGQESRDMTVFKDPINSGVAWLIAGWRG
ncbi:hypothetical protein CYMTET_8068 [Cymbomonas tetramitiformis]|uniref:Glycosyl hydrolase family 32 N-terminal domain-containing protein n=1 Tax=Cymbomonas tetramitiformis TaxID=36881 RepID=A0AAE0LGF9_9CHLO|nr:hypothetical protein CYMTET_8068 [Cymbomonas tetramitiformis]